MKVMASDKKFLKVGNRNEGNGLGQKIFKGRQPK